MNEFRARDTHTPTDPYWTRDVPPFSWPSGKPIHPQGHPREIYPDLSDMPDDGMYRAILTTVARRLHALTPAHREASLQCRPPDYGQPWNALLAALAEHMAESHGHSVPDWCREADRYLNPPRFLFDNSWVASDCLQRVPAAFMRHGAIPDIAELDFRIGESYLWSPRTVRDGCAT